MKRNLSLAKSARKRKKKILKIRKIIERKKIQNMLMTFLMGLRKLSKLSRKNKRW